MIVYQELSSLTRDLGFSARTLYSISNRPGKHYRTVLIPKHNGQTRKLHVPDSLLKTVQRKIAEVLLFHEPISDHACAYRPGVSVKHNALPHVGQKILLNLDIRDFFGSITYARVKRYVFPEGKYSEQLRVLLTLLCVYPDSLPQGAPTSPIISNIVMRDFDEKIGDWCGQRKITYTRYSDDMAFSGDFDPREIIETVELELNRMGFFLNTEKTRIIRDGRRQSVTGIIVNHKTAVPADFRRSIRQTVYYCRKYSVSAHQRRIGDTHTEREFLLQLQGKINYVLSVHSTHEFQDYKKWVAAELNSRRT